MYHVLGNLGQEKKDKNYIAFLSISVVTCSMAGWPRGRWLVPWCLSGIVTIEAPPSDAFGTLDGGDCLFLPSRAKTETERSTYSATFAVSHVKNMTKGKKKQVASSMHRLPEPKVDS